MSKKTKKHNTDLVPTGRAADIAAQTASMTLADKIEYAKLLADSGMIPEAYRKQPANVLVAIEHGQALGLAPIVAVQQIVVVKGRATMEAKLMITLARKAGHIVRLEGDGEHATCTLILADDPGHPRKVTWTRATAEAHGLWGQGHWAKDPALMLQYRAASQAIRLHAPEVLSGVDHTPEEAAEIARRSGASMQVRQVPAAVVAGSERKAPTVRQHMKQLGLTGRDVQEFAGRVLGEEVPVWAKLDEAKRQRVAEGLARWAYEGADWTITEPVDAEVVDIETGEVVS